MRNPRWRARAEQTPDSYLGVYCCSASAGGICTEHAGWESGLLDLRRAHGLAWDDLPEDFAFGLPVALSDLASAAQEQRP